MTDEPIKCSFCESVARYKVGEGFTETHLCETCHELFGYGQLTEDKPVELEA